MPFGAQLKELYEDKPDVFQLIGEGYVLRVPKFTDAEIPRSDYARLPQKYRELARYVDIAVPRFATIVAEGLVPPMSEPGPVNYMIVEWVEGETLDSVTRTRGVPREQLDAFLSGLASYLHQAAASHAQFLADIFHLDQYTFGTAKSVPNERIWLTDLEPQYLRINDPSFDPMPVFLFQAEHVIKSFLHCERYLGQTLASARHAIEQLLAHIAAIDPSAASEMGDMLLHPGDHDDYYSSSWFRRRPSAS